MEGARSVPIPYLSAQPSRAASLLRQDLRLEAQKQNRKNVDSHHCTNSTKSSISDHHHVSYASANIPGCC